MLPGLLIGLLVGLNIGLAFGAIMLILLVLKVEADEDRALSIW